ncbi:hypothetical protein WA99_01565 [Streptococcus agalactiae]|uniref:AAA family ATPase n=1 Tax=Streptococcus agalactiae TaxID=1311 RepID=UPI0006402C2E|nr:AAA family ATPase [Streptococcus agalactiae]KLJ82619.1 hypothetical protein WA99_01565 [Streptococcus agalactiae]
MSYNQVILFGAPGTGKSYRIKDKYIKGIVNHKIFRVTIHPEYTYSDFVGQLLPYVDEIDGKTKFKFQAGPFTKALEESYKDSSTDVYLILEELSRGNVSAIFGDLFQLLDRNDYFESEFPIYNENIAREIGQPTNNVILPSNFNILCTVNTNDQSVFPMDTAFKRRFDWEYITISPAINESIGRYHTELNNPQLIIRDKKGDFDTSWLSFYTALDEYITNKSIGLGKNEDRQIGQFFIKFGKNEIRHSNDKASSHYFDAIDSIDTKIEGKLLRYLWEDVQGKSNNRIENKLFDDSIVSFKDLYEKYRTEQVFNSNFLDKFLYDEPNEGRNRYPYN